MSEVHTATTPLLPEPLAYHRAVRDVLKGNNAAVWETFTSSDIVEEDCEAVRLDLLKNTYRLSKDSDAEYYELAENAAGILGISPTITLYHGGGSDKNAMIAYIPGEAHIIFYGNILQSLTQEEIQGVLAHELGHYRLYEVDEGAYYTAQRMLGNATSHSDSSYTISHSRFQRASEIYADRCALAVCNDYHPLVSSLIKLHTSLERIDVDAYLKQAEEVLTQDKSVTEFTTHPETYIRARALALWDADPTGCEEEVQNLLVGQPELNGLDIVQQAHYSAVTEEFLEVLLSPPWFQTEAVLGQAKLLFPDFKVSDVSLDEVLPTFPWAHESLQSYLFFLMLDFTIVDEALEEAPLAWVLTLADRVELLEEFEKVARKELKTTKKEMMRIFDMAPKLLDEAIAQAAKGADA